MASQAFLTLSKIHDPSEAATLLAAAPVSDQLAHYFNALKLVKSINTNDVFHQYFRTVEPLSLEDKVKIYSQILDVQFGHYIHTQALFCLAQLYSERLDFDRAYDYVSQINVNKINPVEWQLDNLGLLKLKFDIYSLAISVCDKLNNFDKFDEYLKKIHELIITNNSLTDADSSDELSQGLDKLHTFILLKLDKFSEVFKKLYKANQFNELFYILLLFNINHLQEIKVKGDEIKGTPLSPVFRRMESGMIVYYDTYINCLKHLLLQDQSKQTTKDAGVHLSLTRHQILENFKIVVFKHNLYCISQIYDNILLSSLRKILQPDDPEGIEDEEYELSDSMFERILHDSITSGHINAQIDDIEQLVEFKNGKNAPVLTEWNDHIVESCELLDKIVAQV